MGYDAGKGGCDQLDRLGRDSDSGRDAKEHQERRKYESAAHPEHAGQKTYSSAEPDDEPNTHGHFCDWQINHGQTL
jgi:hypothetical protein